MLTRALAKPGAGKAWRWQSLATDWRVGPKLRWQSLALA